MCDEEALYVVDHAPHLVIGEFFWLAMSCAVSDCRQRRDLLFLVGVVCASPCKVIIHLIDAAVLYSTDGAQIAEGSLKHHSSNNCRGRCIPSVEKLFSLFELVVENLGLHEVFERVEISPFEILLCPVKHSRHSLKPSQSKVQYLGTFSINELLQVVTARPSKQCLDLYRPIQN